MRFSQLSLLVCILFALCSCGSGGGDQKTIRIGVLNSNSGDLESFGRSITAAIELAEIEVNALLEDEDSDFRFSFVFKDAQTDPTIALTRLQEFLDEDIRIVIGPMSSGEASALLEFSRQNDMLLISPASTAASLDIAGDNLVRPVGNDTGQAYAIAEALRYFNTKFYAPLYRGDSYGDSLTTDVGERFEDIGGLFAPGARYLPTTTDYTPFLEQVELQVETYEEFQGLGTVGIYIISFDEINKIFAEASQYSRLSTVRWYGSDGSALNASLLQNATTVDFMKRTKMLSPIFVGDIDSTEMKRVRGIIEDQLGERVKPYAVVTYDCVLLLARTLQSLGNMTPSATELRDEMIRISGSVIGATGNLQLTDSGDRAPGDYELWKIVDDGNGGGTWQLGAAYLVTDNNFSNGTLVVYD